MHSRNRISIHFWLENRGYLRKKSACGFLIFANHYGSNAPSVTNNSAATWHPPPVLRSPAHQSFFRVVSTCGRQCNGPQVDQECRFDPTISTSITSTNTYRPDPNHSTVSSGLTNTARLLQTSHGRRHGRLEAVSTSTLLGG